MKPVWLYYFLIFLINTVFIPPLFFLAGLYLGIPAFYYGVFGGSGLPLLLVIALFFLVPVIVGIINKRIFKRVSTRATVFLTASSLILQVIVGIPLFDKYLDFKEAIEQKLGNRITNREALKRVVLMYFSTPKINEKF